MIEITDLRKIYQMGNVEVRALDGVTLDIAKGEFLGIMGPSGSGKTTLLHMLGLLDMPTSGKIVIDGTGSLQTHRLREDHVPALQARVCLPGLRTGPRSDGDGECLPSAMLRKDRTEEQSKKDSFEILQKIGLCDRRDHLPRELSGGQQQRVSLARAMVNKPDILFADEPCANLDTENSRIVLELFKEINEINAPDDCHGLPRGLA